MRPIERAARAVVAELHRQDTGRAIEPADACFVDGLKLGYIDQTYVDVGALVRVVLLAIRGPSEGMIEAGTVRVAETRDEMSAEYAAKEAWRAMIDAALKEG